GPHGRRCLAGQTLYSNGTSADLYARSTEAASGASNTQTHWDPSSFTNEVTQLTWLLRRHGLSRSFQPSRPSVWTAGLNLSSTTKIAIVPSSPKEVSGTSFAHVPPASNRPPRKGRG